MSNGAVGMELDKINIITIIIIMPSHPIESFRGKKMQLNIITKRSRVAFYNIIYTRG